MIPAGEIGAGIGDITFNDSATDIYGVGWSMLTFEGWGATKPNLEVVPKVRGAGAWAGDSYSSARQLSLTGECFAPTPDLARQALDRLNDACTLEDTTFTVYEAGTERYLTVRRSDQISHAWVTPSFFTWGVGLIALDPRKMGVPLTASTALGSSTGGLTVPFTVPYTIATVQVSGQVSLTNPGNEAGPVRMRIDGPVVGPVVTHVASGRQLVFSSSLVLGAGEWIDIDMDAKTVLANGQSSRSGYIISRGWSSFEPGQNTWAFSASSFNPASLLTVTATPADK